MGPIINLRSLGLAFGVLLLPGCVPQTAATGASATGAPATAAPPADPVLRAVATASLATPVSVTSPAYPGPVTVTVTSDYVSAGGQECRAYSLASSAHLACTDGANWREIPSLAPSVNPGFSQ